VSSEAAHQSALVRLLLRGVASTNVMTTNTSQIAIDAMVAPVRASLDKVDEKIASLEKAREHAYGEIRQQFTQMAEVQTQLRDETTNLVKALRQPHVRGRWGEIQLRRVVEMAGMMLHCDFVEQQSAEGDDQPRLSRIKGSYRSSCPARDPALCAGGKTSMPTVIRCGRFRFRQMHRAETLLSVRTP